jgi:hypothetical protein
LGIDNATKHSKSVSVGMGRNSQPAELDKFVIGLSKRFITTGGNPLAMLCSGLQNLS